MVMKRTKLGTIMKTKNSDKAYQARDATGSASTPASIEQKENILLTV